MELDVEQLNITFCDIVGIKPIRGLIINEDTEEVRTYQSINSLYRIPKSWSNCNIKRVIFDTYRYPDFTLVDNFYLLLDIQWQLFGNIGDQYIRIRDESFPVNYLYNKVKALQTIKAYGGSDMLYEFCKKVRECQYVYTFTEEEIDE